MRTSLVPAAIVLVIALAGGIVFWHMRRPGAFESEIAAYEQQDRIHPPEPGGIVFTGSSSIRFWESLADDMKPLHAINRGFGGSQLFQVNQYASRIVIPYRPRAIVLYAGENDMSWPANKSGETVLADFQQFVKLIHTALPGTWILYISMKPDPLRWGNWPALARANKMIEDFCRTQDGVLFIDVSAAMLDAQGKPRRELFRSDGLHMNAQGYALWTSFIKPVLLSRLASEKAKSPLTPVPASSPLHCSTPPLAANLVAVAGFSWPGHRSSAPEFLSRSISFRPPSPVGGPATVVVPSTT
jgi:lysophospholipase L1-like esterase